MTTMDGLDFRPMLLAYLDERHIVGDPVAGPYRLVLPEEPDARPYAVSSLAAELGHSNSTRAWEALKVDPTFFRHDTYLIGGSTVTMARPTDPRPPDVPVSQRPALVWVNPASLRALKTLHSDSATQHMLAGKRFCLFGSRSP